MKTSLRLHRRAIAELLTDELPLHHFVMRYCDRKAREWQASEHGVRDCSLVYEYAGALERAFSILAGPPLGLPPPHALVPVYVFDTAALFPDGGAAFAFEDTGGAPYIGLPSRTHEPTARGEIDRATASAVHELAHVFCMSCRPLREPYSAAWAWFAEATAVFSEWLVLPGNPDTLRFAAGWCDRPETPLDHESAWYEAGMFVRYLVRRCGHAFLRDVWMASDKRETPMEAVVRLLPIEDRRIFFSDYAMDSYFLWDPASCGFAPDVYSRYGDRAVHESFVLRPGMDRKVVRGTLDHLACRYYRVYLADGVAGLDCRVAQSAGCELQARLGIVTAEKRRDSDLPLPPARASLLHLDLRRIDHVVLAVVNSGCTAGHDNLQYELESGVGVTDMKTCFIIMPFDPRYDQLLQRVLRPAAEAAGLKAERVDDIFKPGVILEDIKTCIHHASVLMAVLTEKNANVFYELGIAHAEAKTVVLISNTMDDVPSDLRAHRVLTYNKEDPAWGTHLKRRIVGALEQMMASAP